MTQIQATEQVDAKGTGLKELRDLVRTRSAELDVPGAAVGVAWQGRDYHLTAGVTSVDAPAPVTPDTLFMIGSTTKTVTATAILALVDRGTLDLDTSVVDLLPELALADAAVTASLTLRHLLTHTGGFEGDVEDDELWGPTALADSVATFGSLPQHSPPGAAFSYSNAGLRLAGRLLEAVTGTSYEQAVRDLVLAPLGMAQSYYLPWEVWSRPHAVGHVVEENGTAVAHTWGMGRSAAPEGGLVSSLRDQLAYGRFHLDGTCAGSPPVSDATRRAMQVAQRDAAPPFDAVGLPWLLVDTHGLRAVTHGGNIAGIQLSSLLLLPEHGFALTTLTNAAPGRQLGAEVTDWCLENLLGLDPDPALVPASAAAAVLAAYAGRYDSGTWGMDLAAEEGGLIATFTFNAAPQADHAVLPPPQQLQLCGPDEVLRITAPGEVFGRFERDATGQVVRLLCQGRALHRVR
ncbi:MAG: beta-lactamase [Nocardioides sp.]|nr:beta-lactamase [Nocardioides sp.]